MIIECGNCGAPLDIRDNKRHVTCSYCNLSNRVASARTLTEMQAVEVRKEFVPPAPVVPLTPPVPQEQKFDFRDTPFELRDHYEPPDDSTRLWLLVAVLIALIGVGIGFMVMNRSDSNLRGFAPELLSGPAWDGQSPFRCGGVSEITIEGVNANLPNDTAITVLDNCQLTLIDSRISARVGINAQGNRNVHLRNTVLISSETGVTLGGNRRLILEQSELVSDGEGVHASANAQVQLIGGKLEGTPGVLTEQNARFTNEGGEVIDRRAPIGLIDEVGDDL